MRPINKVNVSGLKETHKKARREASPNHRGIIESGTIGHRKIVFTDEKMTRCKSKGGFPAQKSRVYVGGM